MRGPASLVSAFFAGAVCLAVLQWHPVALFALPPPVAVLWTERRARLTLLVVLLAGVAAMLGAGSLSASLLYTFSAALGIPLGAMFLRGWSYARCVWLLTGVAFPVMGAAMLLVWPQLRQMSRAWLNGHLLELERQQGADSPTAVAMAQVLEWYSDHWDHLTLGLLFGTVLLGLACCVSATAMWLRRRGSGARPGGGLALFRPSDWLVWLVIAVAGLWFLDQRWPTETLRVLVWNSAVGLGFVYWLNGFACLVFTLAVLKVHPFLFAAMILLVLTGGGMHYVLCTFGLFDTWWDLRAKVEKLVEARRLRASEDDRDRR